MKYLSLMIFIFAMYWSWNFIHKASPVTEMAHIGIQEDLKKIITNYIEENLPTAKNIRFERFWTKALNPKQVKALFLYSFEQEPQEEGGGATRTSIEGYAILNREAQRDKSYDVWSFDELFILNNKVAFTEGVTIKAYSTDE